MSAHTRLPAPRRSRFVDRTVNAMATVGSLVTLSALLVLAGAVGGLVDGVATGPATVTVTFDGARQ